MTRVTGGLSEDLCRCQLPAAGQAKQARSDVTDACGQGVDVSVSRIMSARAAIRMAVEPGDTGSYAGTRPQSLPNYAFRETSRPPPVVGHVGNLQAAPLETSADRSTLSGRDRAHATRARGVWWCRIARCIVMPQRNSGLISGRRRCGWPTARGLPSGA